MSAFVLVRASAPAAMPIGEPKDDDPWTLELVDGRWIVSFYECEDNGPADEPCGLDSFLAFLAYLDTPVRVTHGGRGTPTIEILDVEG